MADLELRVLGCRGSMSVAGERYRRYGGNTTCFHVEVEPGHHLIIDCGSGLRSLHDQVAERRPQRYTVVFTHYHWDHIQGLAVFAGLFPPENSFTFYGPATAGAGVESVLDHAISPPVWPVGLDEFGASLAYREVPDSMRVGPVTIRHTSGTHPQGVAIYELAGPRSRVVIATDHEAGTTETDARILALASGADVLVHDAQYTPEELNGPRRGWGHSSYESAAAAASAAGVHRLVLTSHDPNRSDEQIDRLRGSARSLFPNTDAAYEGMSLPL